VADSSSSRHLSQVGSSVKPNFNRCPFRRQSPVSCPTTHLNRPLFNFNRSFVLLAEGPGTSPFACLSPVVDSQWFSAISVRPVPTRGRWYKNGPKGSHRRTKEILASNSDWPRVGRLRGRGSSPGRVKNFHFSMSSRPALGSTQPPLQWVPGSSFPGVKRPGRGSDHSPPTTVHSRRRKRHPKQMNVLSPSLLE
jgi:hypothetical protein